MVIGRAGQSCACAAPQTPSQHVIAAPTIVLTMLSSFVTTGAWVFPFGFAQSLRRRPRISPLSSPRKRGPITTGLWNMGPRLRGDDNSVGRLDHSYQSALIPACRIGFAQRSISSGRNLARYSGV